MKVDTQIAASDVAKAILEITGDALLTGDFDAFAAVVHVPQIMATMGGAIHVETLDDMRRGFDEMHAYFKAVGVTDLICNCIAAEYTSPTRISTTHVSDLLHNGKRLEEPYPVYSVLERIDGNWKVAGGEYALEPSSGQALALSRADASHRPQST